MKVDLRSDTFTIPTKTMLEVMAKAPVGDDVFGEDESVNALEKYAAKLFNMEAGLFCPSGTMTNQIAIKCHTQPMDEVICDKTAHIYNYEGGGIAFNSSASVRLLNGVNGIITPSMVEENINADNVHYPKSSLLSLENTSNRGGGGYYTLDQIKALHLIAKKHQLKFHVDGARVFNALAETGEDSKEYGNYFDSVSICLSKGLGAPVGSVLLGSLATIKQARRIRKVLGGGMRQAGSLAAAGKYALENHRVFLKDDHRRAKQLEIGLSQCKWVKSIEKVHTNIVIAHVDPAFGLEKFINFFQSHQVYFLPFGANSFRMVTHFQFTDDMLDLTLKTIQKANAAN